MHKLHAALLTKLGVMKTFPMIVRISLALLGGLHLHSLDVEAMQKVIQHLASLSLSDELDKTRNSYLILFVRLQYL